MDDRQSSSGLAMKCQECGREISSCTIIEGRWVCSWCLPKNPLFDTSSKCNCEAKIKLLKEFAEYISEEGWWGIMNSKESLRGILDEHKREADEVLRKFNEGIY